MNNWNDRGRFARQREARERFDTSDDPFRQEEIRRVLQQGKTGLLESVARPIMIIVLIVIGSLGWFTFGPAISSGANKHINLGLELAEQGRPHEAIVEFDEAIRRDPKNADAYNHRGNVHRGLSQSETAIRDYGEAIRIDPEFADAYKNRALVHMELGNGEEARKDIELAAVFGMDRGDVESAISDIGNSRKTSFTNQAIPAVSLSLSEKFSCWGF